MSNQAIFDMTRLMEHLINDGVSEIDIMRALLVAAEGASQCKLFRIGDSTYSLSDLEKIQKLEEHEALVAKHRS